MNLFTKKTPQHLDMKSYEDRLSFFMKDMREDLKFIRSLRGRLEETESFFEYITNQKLNLKDKLKFSLQIEKEKKEHKYEGHAIESLKLKIFEQKMLKEFDETRTVLKKCVDEKSMRHFPTIHQEIRDETALLLKMERAAFPSFSQGKEKLDREEQIIIWKIHELDKFMSKVHGELVGIAQDLVRQFTREDIRIFINMHKVDVNTREKNHLILLSRRIKELYKNLDQIEVLIEDIENKFEKIRADFKTAEKFSV
jgi:hypothetical protein